METLIGVALAGMVAGMFIAVAGLAAIGRKSRGGPGSSDKIGMGEQITVRLDRNGPSDEE